MFVIEYDLKKLKYVKGGLGCDGSDVVYMYIIV